LIARKMAADEKTKLFVGGLPWELTQKQLHAYFTRCVGKVHKCELAINKATGESRGFGFVTMQHESDTQAALEQLHIINGIVSTVRKSDSDSKGKGKGKGKDNDQGTEMVNNPAVVSSSNTVGIIKVAPNIAAQGGNTTSNPSAEKDQVKAGISEVKNEQKGAQATQDQPKKEPAPVDADAEMDFETAEEAQEAQKRIDGYTLRGSILSAKIHPDAGTRLVVKGVPKDITEEELSSLVEDTAEEGMEEWAEEYGDHIVNCEAAEVKFKTAEEASWAVFNLDSSNVGGADISVEADSECPDGKWVIVRGIPEGLEWAELKRHLGFAGKVLSCKPEGTRASNGKAVTKRNAKQPSKATKRKSTHKNEWQEDDETEATWTGEW